MVDICIFYYRKERWTLTNMLELRKSGSSLLKMQPQGFVSLPEVPPGTPPCPPPSPPNTHNPPCITMAPRSQHYSPLYTKGPCTCTCTLVWQVQDVDGSRPSRFDFPGWYGLDGRQLKVPKVLTHDRDCLDAALITIQPNLKLFRVRNIQYRGKTTKPPYSRVHTFISK